MYYDADHDKEDTMMFLINSSGNLLIIIDVVFDGDDYKIKDCNADLNNDGCGCGDVVIDYYLCY